MKIQITKDSKQVLRLNQAPIARRIVETYKDDGATVKEYAGMAINVALDGKCDYLVEVYKATAEISRNCRAWNELDDSSEDLDIWVEAVAQTAKGFVTVGAYLTDIWQTGGVPAAELADRMFIRYFREA